MKHLYYYVLLNVPLYMTKSLTSPFVGHDFNHLVLGVRFILPLQGESKSILNTFYNHLYDAYTISTITKTIQYFTFS